MPFNSNKISSKTVETLQKQADRNIKNNADSKRFAKEKKKRSSRNSLIVTGRGGEMDWNEKKDRDIHNGIEEEGEVEGGERGQQDVKQSNSSEESNSTVSKFLFQR